MRFLKIGNCFSAWSATPFRPFSIQAAFKIARPHQPICWPCLIDGAACPFTAFAALTGRGARSSCAEGRRFGAVCSLLAARGRRCGRCKIVRLFACLLLPVFFHACLSAARWSIALLALWPSRQPRGDFEAQALRAGGRSGAGPGARWPAFAGAPAHCTSRAKAWRRAEPGLSRACWHSSARPKPA